MFLSAFFRVVCEFLNDVGILGAIFCVVFFLPLFVVLAPFFLIVVLLEDFNEVSKGWFSKKEKP